MFPPRFFARRAGDPDENLGDLQQPLRHHRCGLGDQREREPAERYVPHYLVSEFEAAGWVFSESLGAPHGFYSVLMELPIYWGA